jgi:NADPH:quinone reductase-like Zn-dependent oxidoreductase
MIRGGGFAEYAVAPAHSIMFEEAATVLLVGITAAIAL